jgi:hypothetical protein
VFLLSTKDFFKSQDKHFVSTTFCGNVRCAITQLFNSDAFLRRGRQRLAQSINQKKFGGKIERIEDSVRCLRTLFRNELGGEFLHKKM